MSVFLLECCQLIFQGSNFLVQSVGLFAEEIIGFGCLFRPISQIFVQVERGQFTGYLLCGICTLAFETKILAVGS